MNVEFFKRPSIYEMSFVQLHQKTFNWNIQWCTQKHFKLKENTAGCNKMTRIKLTD